MQFAHRLLIMTMLAFSDIKEQLDNSLWNYCIYFYNS